MPLKACILAEGNFPLNRLPALSSCQTGCNFPEISVGVCVCVFRREGNSLRMEAPKCSRALPHKLMQTRGPLFPDPSKLNSFVPVYPLGALRACLRKGLLDLFSPNSEGGRRGHGLRREAGHRECGWTKVAGQAGPGPRGRQPSPQASPTLRATAAGAPGSLGSACPPA